MATEQSQKLITITPKAAEKIHEFMAEEAENLQNLLNMFRVEGEEEMLTNQLPPEIEDVTSEKDQDQIIKIPEKTETKKEDAKKPVRIVRSKKSTAKLHRISRQDNKLIRKEEVEQIDEALPIAVAPIAVNVARAVGTKVVKNVLKKQIKKRAKKAARRGALASKLMNRSSNKSSGSSVTGTNRRSSSGGSKAGAGNIATSTARDRSKDRRDELDKERLRRQKERERRQKMARDD